MLILHLEYSASSGPPCPSKILIVYASRYLSWEKQMLSSQGLFASYCRAFIRLSMTFLFRKSEEG